MHKPLVIIPSYNTGARLTSTVSEVLSTWKDGPVWVAIDGSTDGSDHALEQTLCKEPRLRILRLPQNAGKGRAVITCADEALAKGFTYACVFDADGQHLAADIGRMFAELPKDVYAIVLGVPIFGTEAPPARVKGRRFGNTFAKIETLWQGPEDSLYGMRVYPLEPLVRLMQSPLRGRRYDFDTEAAVRLTWSGIRPINFPTHVRYLSKSEGGVSHFKYLRDNVLLTLMHIRLLVELPFRALPLLARCSRWKKGTRR